MLKFFDTFELIINRKINKKRTCIGKYFVQSVITVLFNHEIVFGFHFTSAFLLRLFSYRTREFSLSIY